MKYLAGDIGGTKTVVAIYAEGTGPSSALAQKTYPSADYPSLEAIVHAFCDEQNVNGEDFVSATFGVAGPVVSGLATITNLPWKMSEEMLVESLKIP